MFGYLPAPCRCQIGREIDLYRSTFCGVCNALAGQYGLPARLLTNRDSTFVALLAAAQAPDAPVATLSTRCQPWGRPLPVFESGPIPAFAGAVTLCGLQAKLDDERSDERGLRAAGSRLLSTLARTRFARAQAILDTSDFPVADTRRQLGEQAGVEARIARGSDPAEAAQPSARAFGSILAHTARLAGNDANIDPLYRTGHSLGELIYTLDACQDLHDDRRHGRFNFLAEQIGVWQPGSLERVTTLAQQIASGCQRRMREAWQQVELLRHRPVLEAILLTGLAARTDRILAADAPGAAMTSDGDLLPSEEKDRSNRYASCCNGWQCCYCLDCDCAECCCNNDCSGCDCGDCDCGGCDCNT